MLPDALAEGRWEGVGSEGGPGDCGEGSLLCGRSGIVGVLVGLAEVVGGFVRGGCDRDLSVAAFCRGGSVVALVVGLAVVVGGLVGSGCD